MDKKSLSSTYLYHFKNDIEVIKTILQNGFTYRMWDESIPYKISIQQNFMVCFCDIRIVDSQSHRDVYGNNAIVLTKAWGINKGVTPVQYIHKNSPVISKKYLDLKTSFRQIRDDGNDKIEAVLNDYMVHLMLKYKKKSTNGLFQDEIDYSLNDKEIIENEFHDILEFCKEGKKDIIKFISSLFLRIVDLHGELECRDSYMKIYKDNFTYPPRNITIKDKIFYDEKEWRSIKILSILDDYDSAIKNRYLSEKYNLKFEDDDLVAILVENQENKDRIINFLQSNKDYLIDKNKTISKIRLIDSFQEAK